MKLEVVSDAQFYAYHPGNVAHSSAMEVEDTIPLISRSLGIDLVCLLKGLLVVVPG